MEAQIKMTMKYLICLVLWLKSKALRMQILAETMEKRNSHFIVMINAKMMITVESKMKKSQSEKLNVIQCFLDVLKSQN